MLWAVARFPDGSWSTGDRSDSPDYAECEVWLVEAERRAEAEKKGKRLYRNQVARARRATAKEKI